MSFTNCALLRSCAWHRSVIRCCRLASRCCSRGNSWDSRCAHASCSSFARLTSSASARRRASVSAAPACSAMTLASLWRAVSKLVAAELRRAAAARTACDAPSSSARLRRTPAASSCARASPCRTTARPALSCLTTSAASAPCCRTCSSPSRSASSVLISAFLNADSGRFPWAENTDVKKVSAGHRISATAFS